jgi:hypothetical protein
MKHFRKPAVVLGTIAVVGVIGVTMALASGTGELTKSETIHVTAVGGQFAFLQENPSSKTEFGDVAVISAPVFRGHTRVGRLHAVCTFFDKPGIAAECTITTYLHQGAIVVQGLIDFGKKNHTMGAITGGTRGFRNARGQVVFANSTGDTEGFAFQLEP